MDVGGMDVEVGCGVELGIAVEVRGATGVDVRIGNGVGK